ncbi:MAG: putative bifunctional diguanylate cyclase/phosphodiesterase [Pyrinomonadaceae bacterium]
MGKQRYIGLVTWGALALGAGATLYSAAHFPLAQLDARFLMLALITIAFGSRLTVQIPHAKVHASVPDTFIFLTLLLYSGEAAVLLAAAEAFYSCLYFGKKEITIRTRTMLFNAAVMAGSTFLTVWVLRLGFGSIQELTEQPLSSAYCSALGVMALVQYVASTGFAALFTACKNGEPLWQTWKRHYLWISVTYFLGAAAAGVIVRAVGQLDLSAILITTGVIAIIYFTYQRYIEDVKSSAAQAESAERARAEAERERAEQAERHVGELSHYIAELERTGQALQDSKEHFRHAAFHDSLTGLANRDLLTENLRFVIERTKLHPESQFAVLFLDLDRFKNINDSLGHTVGDGLLVAMARRLEHCVRDVDTVARLGGDEFAILLDGVLDAGEALQLAERVLETLTRPFNLNGYEVFTSASIGITLSSLGYERPDDLLRDADTAMYHAKQDGKACYQLFDKVMHAHAVNLLKLETDLRRAIEREEFCVYYQPIVALDTGHVSGFEALVRWQHPERGLINPSEFIPLVEETGMIIPIGMWVLREACQQVHQWQWQSPLNRSLTLSVNLSGKQFAQSDLVEQIKQILRETNLQPQHLRLEITESVVMKDAEAATAMLNQLRAVGVRLSIDDFGTGYSSLSYLHRFPVDTMKIDRSFVSRMTENEEHSEIARTILTLATNLGMQVVAEGVETLEQMARLRAMNCDYGQGYLFSKPVPGEAAATLLTRRTQGQAPTYFTVPNPAIVERSPLLLHSA